MQYFLLLFLLIFSIQNILGMEEDWAQIQHTEEKLIYDATAGLLTSFLRNAKVAIPTQCEKYAQALLNSLMADENPRSKKRLQFRGEGNRCLQCGEPFSVSSRYNKTLCKVCVLAHTVLKQKSDLHYFPSSPQKTFCAGSSSDSPPRSQIDIFALCLHIMHERCPKCLFGREIFSGKKVCTFCAHEYGIK